MSMKALQVAVNDCASAILGKARADRLSVEDLLKATGLPSVNQATVKACSVEYWKAMNMRDTAYGPHWPVHDLIVKCDGHTRSAASNLVRTPPPPPRSVPSFLYSGAKLWNAHPELREANSLSVVKRMTEKIKYMCPM